MQLGNVKKSEKSVKTVNIEGKNLYIFLINWVISMKFSGRMWLMIILKVTKKAGFHPLSRKHIFGKNTKEGSELTPPPPPPHPFKG